MVRGSAIAPPSMLPLTDVPLHSGIELGCKIRQNPEWIPELCKSPCDFDRNVVPIQR